MYQDLSFMRIPLPEDVLKLKSFGDFEGAQKMIQHFLSKDIPQSLRKRLEIEEDIIRVCLLYTSRAYAPSDSHAVWLSML